MICDDLVCNDNGLIKRKKTTKQTLDDLFFEIENKNDLELISIPLMPKECEKNKEENKMNIFIETKDKGLGAFLETFNRDTPCSSRQNREEEEAKHLYSRQENINNPHGPQRGKKVNQFMRNLNRQSYMSCQSNANGKQAPISLMAEQPVKEKSRLKSSFFDDGYSSHDSIDNSSHREKGSNSKMIQSENFQGRQVNKVNNSLMKTSRPKQLSINNKQKLYNINYSANRARVKEYHFDQGKSRNKENTDSVSSQTTRGKQRASTQRQKGLRDSIRKPTKLDQGSKSSLIDLLDQIKQNYKKEERQKITKEKDLLNEITALKSRISQIEEVGKAQSLSKGNYRPRSLNSKKSPFAFSSAHCVTNSNVSGKTCYQENRDIGVIRMYNESFFRNNTEMCKEMKESDMSQLITELGVNTELIADNKPFFCDSSFNKRLVQAIESNQIVKAFIKLLANDLTTKSKSYLLFEEKVIELVLNDKKKIIEQEKRINALEEALLQSQFDLNKSHLTQNSTKSII